jgi:hypothetical protein
MNISVKRKYEIVNSFATASFLLSEISVCSSRRRRNAGTIYDAAVRRGTYDAGCG